MDSGHPYALSNIWKQVHPRNLLAGVLIYALGAGVAHYLGHTIHWEDYLAGQGSVTFIQISSYLLNLYFDNPKPSSSTKSDSRTPLGDQPSQITITRENLLYLIYCSLTVGSIFTVLLLTNQRDDINSILLLGLVFLISFIYGVPPLRLAYSGYGELTQAFLITNIFPAFAFAIQAGQLHRLLALMTFPLTLLFLSMILALSLATYAADQKNNRKTLMIRMGWQQGMKFHNLLLLSAYLILVLSPFFGLPWSLTWPGLLTIPIAAFQIFQMNQIAAGAKPRWKLLEYTAAATIIFTVYFFTLAIWTR